MSRPETYPPGVPCFVETMSADPAPLRHFYAGIFGWEFAGSGPLPTTPGGEYLVARIDGRDVAGIAPPPAPSLPSPPPAWSTQVAVASVADAAARVPRAGGRVLVEPFDALPAGRLAVISDPAGAVICLWEPGARAGAGVVNEPSAWAMSLLSTDDPEGAAAFYGELFGWRADPFEPAPGVRLWLWRLPGYVGGEPEQPVPRDVVAAMGPGQDGAGANWSVEFWVADAERAAADAPGLGGRVIAAPFEMPMFRRAVLADPQGAVFTVSQLMLPG